MIRKPIQIVGVTSPLGDADLYALCNDGTMWGLNSHGNWIEMPAIPQDESQDPLVKLQADSASLADAILHGDSFSMADPEPGNLSRRVCAYCLAERDGQRVELYDHEGNCPVRIAQHLASKTKGKT